MKYKVKNKVEDFNFDVVKYGFVWQIYHKTNCCYIPFFVRTRNDVRQFVKYIKRIFNLKNNDISIYKYEKDNVC